MSMTLSSGVSGPAVNAAAITPGDTATLPFVTRAIWVGVSGNLRVLMVSGADVTFANIQVGWHPLRVTRVFATSTTASSLVGIE